MSDQKTAQYKIPIPIDDSTLLAACTVTTFRSSGKGGQHVNKTDSAVRIRHRETGITATSQRERSQYLNKMLCLKKLRERLHYFNTEPTPRIKTEIPERERRRRRSNKTYHSRKKQLRKPPDTMDD